MQGILSRLLQPPAADGSAPFSPPRRHHGSNRRSAALAPVLMLQESGRPKSWKMTNPPAPQAPVATPLVIAPPKQKQAEMEQSPSKPIWRDSQEGLGRGADHSKTGAQGGAPISSQKRKLKHPKGQSQQDQAPSDWTSRPPRGSTRVVYGGEETTKQASEKQRQQGVDWAAGGGRAGGLPAPIRKGWCPNCRLMFVPKGWCSSCRCAPSGARRGYHT